MNSHKKTKGYTLDKVLPTSTPSKKVFLYHCSAPPHQLPSYIVVKKYDLSGLNLQIKRLIRGVEKLEGKWERYN
jgi:hypothetical protein